VSSINQIGEGHESYLDAIAEKVFKKLNERSSPEESEEASVSSPTLIALHKTSSLPPPQYASEVKKDDENDRMLESTLLKLIPKSKRSNGEKLLQKISENSNQFSYNYSGTIFINGESIPLSNIFQIFPLLFQTYKKNSKIPGYLESTQQLTEMGLGHLLASPRIKNEQKHQTFDKVKMPWYYLGP
jgi:hypothetical protein